MKKVDDFVDFEDGKRHGWENDIGSMDGELKTEHTPAGLNTFWSGKLQPKHIPEPIEMNASLAKLFTLAGDEQQHGMFSVSFEYRVHRPEPGEAIRIYLTLTGEIALGYISTEINENTPVGEWLKFGPTAFFYGRNRTPVLIGSYGTPDNRASFRKIDIDNIRVLQDPVKN